MKRFKPLVTVLFIVYCLCMLWLLFGQRLDSTRDGTYFEELRSMLFPFQTIVQFVRIIMTGKPADVVPHAWQNLIGNVVMFMPVGMCLPFFFSRCRFAKSTFLIGLLIVTCIELTQFFTLLGSLDFDDFLLNMIGIMLGFAVFKLFWAKMRD